MSIGIDDLAAEISKELEGYTSEIIEGTNKAVDKVAKEVNNEIKSHIQFKERTGDYVKSFKLETTVNRKTRKVKTWHVKAPHYRLTHLLENGHVVAGGGRTKAYPHIKYGEEIAKKRMEELVTEVIENAGR